MYAVDANIYVDAVERSLVAAFIEKVNNSQRAYCLPRHVSPGRCAYLIPDVTS